ncbi:MAG TPA: RNA polymerase sigma factor RpoD/SigA [Bacteroidia bacterium]|jgi:RNA polymerase primary sigma factor
MRQLTISKSITARNEISLDKYLAEISRHSLISVEEETLLARKIREGDNDALCMLVKANLRFVVSVAKQYQHLGLSLPDLVNEGNLGLMKAAGRFDETRGFKFISYAVWWIRQSIIQAIAEQSRLIRLPMNKIGILNKIKKVSSILEQELERNASSEEIAIKLDLSNEEVNAAQEVSGYHVSFDTPFSDQDGTLIDLMYDPENPLPDNSLFASSLSIEIRRALAKLSEKEAEVIILFYGIGIPHAFTLNEIGERFELTAERVRQIKEKALFKLRGNRRNRQLQTYLG